jgi:hypothetical protein
MADSAPTAADLTADAIAVAAQQPQSATVDGQTAAAHSIPDQHAALRVARTASALTGNRSAWGCTRTARVTPPGATG